jgi:hypothetical protein
MMRKAIVTTHSTVIARLDRVIQYTVPAQFDFDASVYRMPRLKRGMTSTARTNS